MPGVPLPTFSNTRTLFLSSKNNCCSTHRRVLKVLLISADCKTSVQMFSKYTQLCMGNTRVRKNDYDLLPSGTWSPAGETDIN